MNSIRKILYTFVCLFFIILMVEIGFFYIQNNREPLNINTASLFIPTSTEEPKQFILDRFEGISKLIREDLTNKVLTISFERSVI